jgi:hypothetical protein
MTLAHAPPREQRNVAGEPRQLRDPEQEQWAAVLAALLNLPASGMTEPDGPLWGEIRWTCEWWPPD